MTTHDNDQDQDEEIRSGGSIIGNFTMIPNMAVETLSNHELLLYVYYVFICGMKGRRTCKEAVRTTAKKCGFSNAKLLETRASLVEKGYVRIIREGTPNEPGVKGQTAIVGIGQMWADNFVRYATPEEIELNADQLPDRLLPDHLKRVKPQPDGDNTPQEDDNPPNEVDVSAGTPNVSVEKPNVSVEKPFQEVVSDSFQKNPL